MNLLGAAILKTAHISICSDQRRAVEHVRRFNAPTANEVAILMPDDPEVERDIIIRHRDDFLQKIS